MADFVYGPVSCDFSNDLVDHLVMEACLAAFKISAVPAYEVVKYTNPEGVEMVRMISTENPAVSFLRSYCIIAGHSRNVKGLDEWRQPTMFSSVEEIQESSVKLFRLVTSDCVQSWAKTLNATIFPAPAVVSKDEQGAGDESDFHQPVVNESTSGS